MAVEPVYTPGSTHPPTPGQEMNDPTKDQYWRKKAMEMRDRRDYLEEQKAIEQLNARPAAPPESPIKMTGEISLGKIDFTEQARQAQAQLAAQNQAAEQRAAQMEAERDEANRKAEAMKEQLLAQTISAMQNNLTSQIAKLNEQMTDKNKPITQKSFAEQLREITDSVAALGYVRPDQMRSAAPVAANATDAAIQLEILRMNMDEKNKDRQFQWAMQQDNRKWALELKKLDLQNNQAKAELEAKRSRDEMLWKAPAILGDAVAKGLTSQARRPAPSVQRRPTYVPNEQPVDPGPAPVRPQPADAQQLDNLAAGFAEDPTEGLDGALDAEPGASGETECPNCKEQIVIGPTAERAVCASCGYTVGINRKAAS